jgi:hypothetical protein
MSSLSFYSKSSHLVLILKDKKKHRMLHNENIQLGIVQKFEISMFFFYILSVKTENI